MDVARGDFMRYTLFNKNVPVLDLDVDAWYGHVLNIAKVYNPEALPLLAKFNPSTLNGIREWLQDRSIPSSRIHGSGTKLSIQNLGLNLSDQFWLCPEGSGLSWQEVNLFHNRFDRKYVNREGNYLPEFSSNGQQEKYWEIRENRRVLIKESRGPFYQESSNEVFASVVLERLGMNHISYTKEGDNSVCETYINENTEYVPATHVLNAVKKNNNESSYTHLLHCMEKLEIPAQKADIDNMIVFDYLIDNIDRNYGNFGFIRKAEGGEFIGFFPYFDHGNSMWYMEADGRITASSLSQKTKPFYDKAMKQLDLAEDISAPFGALSKDFLEKRIVEVYSDILTGERISRLTSAVHARLDIILGRKKLVIGDQSSPVLSTYEQGKDTKSNIVKKNETENAGDRTNQSGDKIRKARLEASRKRQEKINSNKKSGLKL